MFLVQVLVLSAFAIIVTEEEWVEIPQFQSFGNTSKISEMNIITQTDKIENFEAGYTTISPKINKRILENKKSSIMDVFTSTTEFTPLMSSVSVANSPETTPTPTESRNIKRNKIKKKNEYQDNGIDIEDAPVEYIINDPGFTDNKFNSYLGFMPFIRSIQSNLFQKAHKTVKSKIEVLKNLRDNLLYDIDQRIKGLWSTEENSAREYKGESHMEFPSNESALMTIGFLTLATFLVKLILKLIAAIKAKKQMKMMTTTTTMASVIQLQAGRKKRSEPEDYLDIESTYRILNLIDNFKVNSFDHN